MMDPAPNLMVGKPLTATEIIEARIAARAEDERARDQRIAEMLGPYVERALAILRRRGLLPEEPG